MKLQLGPLPDLSTVKMTVAIPSALRAQLDKYAEIYSRNFDVTVDAATLVPLMLAMFLVKDKVFQRAIRQAREH